MTKTYRVDVRSDGPWWFFEVPEIGMSGQAPKLSEVEFEASDIIATALQIETESVDVELSVEVRRLTGAGGGVSIGGYARAGGAGAATEGKPCAHASM